MSERERWIVYPLLFFALGAAVRDKILHRVDAKEIYCESLKIVDQQDPSGRALVELSIERASSNDPDRHDDRMGTLRLVDGAGQEVCRIDSKSLQIVTDQQVSQIDSSSLTIVGQSNSQSPAVAELSVKRARPNDPTQLADSVGLLRLVDNNGNVVCHLDENAFLQRVISRRLDVIDEENRVRAVATTETVPALFLPNGEETTTSQGVIYLNNQKVGMKLAPPAERQTKPKLLPDRSL